MLVTGLMFSMQNFGKDETRSFVQIEFEGWINIGDISFSSREVCSVSRERGLNNIVKNCLKGILGVISNEYKSWHKIRFKNTNPGIKLGLKIQILA